MTAIERQIDVGPSTPGAPGLAGCADLAVQPSSDKPSAAERRLFLPTQSLTQVLNAGYANTLTNGLDSGMRFVLSDVRYLSHDTWYSLCNVHARAITQAHTVRADTHLNVFTCSGEGLLG